MKRLLATWVMTALLIYPSICMATYLIQLTNGKEFIIPEYWEEGNQVKFYYYGGLITIDKDQIQAITESDKAYVEEVLETRAPESPGIGAKQPAAETKLGAKKSSLEKKTAPENGKTEEEVDIEYYKGKKAELMSELDETLKRVREATRNKDLEAKKKAKEDMRRVAKQIYDLTDELKKENDGVLPDGWHPGHEPQ